MRSSGAGGIPQSNEEGARSSDAFARNPDTPRSLRGDTSAASGLNASMSRASQMSVSLVD